MTGSADADALRALADRCVMCGLCLPHCPTYALAADEAESPRGRIALTRAIVDGRLHPDAVAIGHIDQCLGCRSCESACPSDVAFEQILVRIRAIVEPHRTGRSLIHRLTASPRLFSLLARLLVATRATSWLPPFAALLPAGSPWRRWLREMPRPASRLAVARRSTPTAKRSTLLFQGCVAGSFDRDTLAAAQRLLSRLGHAVMLSESGLCCGALPRHGGHGAAAGRLTKSTHASLASAIGAGTIAVTASGCHGSLLETMQGSGCDIVDATALIVADDAFPSLRFRPLAHRAVLHLPCSQVNGSRSVDATRRALARIPALTVIDLPTKPNCCGAAGIQFLEQPAIADALRNQRLDQVDDLEADLLLTSNIGCRMHLANGLRHRGRPIETIHPLTLLARQLEEA